MPKRLRGLLINLGVLFATLVILVAVLEVLFRVLYIQPMSVRAVHLHQPSDIDGLVYEFIPNLHIRGFKWETISTDSRGFRSKEIDPNKPTIAIIGDSFAFGYGVDDTETHSYYLQQQFPNYNIVNTGVNGYNIEQEALVMEHKVEPLQPKLLIVEFVFNDMDPKGHFDKDGIIHLGEKTEAEVKAEITKPGLINFPGKLFLHENSAIFRFLERNTKWLPFRKTSVDIHKDPITPADIGFYQEWFTRLADSADKVKGMKKIFVIWPENNLHEQSKKIIKNIAEERGFDVIDLYDYFGNGYRHLGWDYHPHPTTHKKVADILAEKITKLLPSE